MAIRPNGTSVPAIVGELSGDIEFVVTDGAGNLAPNVPVSIEVDPTAASLDNGRAGATVFSGAAGTPDVGRVRVKARAKRDGTIPVRAYGGSFGDASHEVQAVRPPPQPDSPPEFEIPLLMPRHPPQHGAWLWPIVVGLLGLCFLAGIAAMTMVMLDRSPITVEKPFIVTQEKVIPPVDNQARTAIAANEKRDDAQDARLVEEDNINWAIGGNAQRALSNDDALQRALSNDDALQRDFHRFLTGGTRGSAPAARGGVCAGPHWALYERCRLSVR